jgi:hypothetical protein
MKCTFIKVEQNERQKMGEQEIKTTKNKKLINKNATTFPVQADLDQNHFSAPARQTRF